MKEKSIFRVIKNADNPYVMVDKRIIQNKQLSWKAKGILIYLLSRPDNWTAQMQDIINQSTDGESATRAGVQELIDAGYLVRRVEHNKETGQFIKWMEVYESPQEKPKEQPEEVTKPTSDFPHVGNPHVGNRNVNNTESTNINDDDDGAKKQKNIFTIYSEHVGPLTPFISDMLKEAEALYPFNWIEAAFKIAVEHNARNWKYVSAILEDWQRRGFMAPRPGTHNTYGKKEKPVRKSTRREPTPEEAEQWRVFFAEQKERKRSNA